MKIIFIGTGEACDPARRNTSLLIEHGGLCHLLDCGFTTPSGYLQLNGECPLSSIWISHFHGDHFFGLPQLMVFSYMKKRTAPLTIFTGIESRQKILSSIDLAYPGLSDKLTFPLLFKQIEEDKTVQHDNLTWRICAVDHSQPAYGLRVEGAGRSLYYSGDGKPSAAARSLMESCDLVVHEAFSRQPAKPSHASIEECIDIAEELKLPRMALVHINRESRNELAMPGMELPVLSKTILWIPDDGDTLTLADRPAQAV